MSRIKEVSGGQWHWLMRFWGALPSDGGNAETRAGYSNIGYGIVKVDGKVIGIVTRYDYDNPRYFVDRTVSIKVTIPELKNRLDCASLSKAMVI